MLQGRDFDMALDEAGRVCTTTSVCLVTVHGFPKIGGGEERFLEHFTSYLQKRGIRFAVVSSTVDSNASNVSGVGVKPFKLPMAGSTPYLFLFSVIACLRVIFLNKRYHFSLVHSIDSGYAGLAGLFASKILRLGFVVHVHCCRSRLVTLSLALRGDIWRHVLPVYEKFESLIDETVMKHADRVVAVSSEIGAYALSLGVSSERLLVNPVGLDVSSMKCSDTDKESVIREFGMPPNAFVIGYLGSLATVKGTRTLVEAFASIRRKTKDDLFLLMVGDGDKSNLENLVKRERLSSVIFAGFRSDVPRFLAAMDVFVLPSMSEGCPYSLLEAMAAGKAIVASDIPGIREVVRNGHEALLIHPCDSNILGETLLRMYADSGLRSQLRTGAEKRATRYDNETVFSKIVEMYPSLGDDSIPQPRN
jgi:glycosyltransferase involved in cell wall biosynthesis